MRVRTLGRTGLRVSEMALGTWGLSGDGYGPVDEAEQERVIRRALEMGFTLIETADAYGNGRMEELMGRALRDPELDDVVVVTKGGVDRATSPPRKRFETDYLRNCVHGSLKRLQRERIDVFLLHNPSPAVLSGAPPAAVTALVQLKKEGKIAHWGVSVGDVAIGRAAMKHGAEVIEIAYNLLNASDLHRLAGEVMVSGAGVLARSTLAYGLLAGSWEKDRKFSPGDHRADRWTRVEFGQRIDQASAVEFLLNRNIRTMASAAVRYVLANSIVSSAVLGPRSVNQLEDIVREVGMGPVYIRDADLARLPRLLEAVGVEL
ncbi:MAG: aldo/keto reductase [Polyangiaceae bacterium]